MAGLVVVAMSGGVDSSVAAALLKQQGYDVMGITLNVWPEKSLVEADTRHSACCSLDSVEDARRVADLVGIPHYTLNFRDIFDRTVIEDFAQEYLRGRTPNPCVRCNRFVKFDALLAKARSLGAEWLATGHYARVGRSEGGRYLLRKAVDGSKDQSYALYSLTQEQLAHTLFPLGGMEKSETRRIAAKLGLVTAEKPDSQEICFVPDNDYSGFLRRRIPSAARPGPILDRKGEVLGTHPGIAFFTVGQRKGLGLASGDPLYVLEIIPERNAVVVGKREALYSPGLIAEDLNWVSVEQPAEPIRVEARIRYRAVAVPAAARMQEEGRLLLEFDEPQRAVSPGQSVVLYQGDRVVAGGTIERAIS
ncbi:MAG: tRNA 2-thiouridine(34) synthase MnmA [Chloroflexota bacterium]